MPSAREDAIHSRLQILRQQKASLVERVTTMRQIWSEMDPGPAKNSLYRQFDYMQGTIVQLRDEEADLLAELSQIRAAKK